MSLWTPRGRVLHRPDGRGLVVPRLSGEPLGDEVDYDDLRIHHSWRVYEPDRPDEVRYLMYQLSQRDLGSPVWAGYFKAVRFLRVTRVPRYLRQVNTSASGTVFDHQRKLLAGLREQDVVFLNLIANGPDTPMIFAYGVQAIGNTPEQAQTLADRSYSVLRALLDGVYQQLEYQPLRVDEAEALVRYQSQWRQIAMARGRPKPLGADGGVDSWLDGNRTDVENTQNMLETFIRGMSDRNFLLSLVTVPISPAEMSPGVEERRRLAVRGPLRPVGLDGGHRRRGPADDGHRSRRADRRWEPPDGLHRRYRDVGQPGSDRHLRRRPRRVGRGVRLPRCDRG